MTLKVEHDLPPGPVSRCQIDGSENLELVIDLGHQPLCDSLLTSEELNQPESNYPLRLFRCLECGNGQLDYVVPGEVVFHKSYPYVAGITQEVVDHHREQSRTITKRFGLTEKSLVVDIGSNDGTLLSGFRDLGVRTLGVEPTDVAKIAREKGIETIQSPFNEAIGRELSKEYGQASIVTATNVFAHMASLGEVTRGAEILLQPDGVFVTESHYLLDIIRDVQYDSIYHEHIRSYSLRGLVRLFDQYDFTVVDAERVERYGGSLRVYAMRGKERPISDSVVRLLEEEEAFGLYDAEVYRVFRERVGRSKTALLELALTAHDKGETFVGNSCPGRCSTLLNYVGIGPDLMPYIAEQPTSRKLGLYLPGKHIPVVNNDVLFQEQPDYVVLLAWHYWRPISQLLRDRGLKSRFIVPLPEPRVLDPT